MKVNDADIQTNTAYPSFIPSPETFISGDLAAAADAPAMMRN
jgi:hypothetical protein